MSERRWTMAEIEEAFEKNENDVWSYLRNELIALPKPADKEFDQMAAGLESLSQKGVDGDTGFIRGARWMWERMRK